MSTIIVVSILNIVCFLIGAIVGQRVLERKPVIMNPVKEIKEHKEQIEISKEEQRFEDLGHNIDIYDGTPLGQKRIGG